jgi:molecular chaperone GrpE (heat shock protein)
MIESESSGGGVEIVGGTEVPPPAPSAENTGEPRSVVAGTDLIPGDVTARLDGLVEQVASLRETLGGAVAARDREALMRELHAELQDCRAGTHWRILRPVLIDLVKLLDDLHPLPSEPHEPGAALSGLPVGLIGRVEDILERQGFRRFRVEGDRFDPKRQESVRVEPTTDANQAGLIAGRVASGYQSEERVLRAERVIVYGLRSPPS